tara:strand:- start:410 stop:2362 length:1953 start_codon:yes stop_codon:yes gene_type:complete
MANKVTFEIIAKALGFGKTDGKVKKLSGSMKKFAAGLVTTAAAYKAIGAAVEGVQLAGKLEGVERAFDGMRKQAGFSVNTFAKLDKALDGTVDKLTVMEQANNAMLLGIAASDDQMAEMFDTAQRLAQAVGKDATFGIESLVTGLGRQSKLMLDNLGIIVDVAKANEEYAKDLGKTASALSDGERKQAFINKALSEGKRLVEGLGEEQKTAAQKIETFSASITNLKTAVGQALIESGALDSWNKYSGILINVANSYIATKKEEDSYSQAQIDNAQKVQKWTDKNEEYMRRIRIIALKRGEEEQTYFGERTQAEHELRELMLKTGFTEQEIHDNTMRAMENGAAKLQEFLDIHYELEAEIVKEGEAQAKLSEEQQKAATKAKASADEELRQAELKKAMIAATIDMNKELMAIEMERVQAEQEKFAAMDSAYSDWLDTNFTSETDRLEAERTAMLENVEQYENAEVHKAKIDDFYDKKKKKMQKAQAVADRQAFAENASSAFSSFAAIGEAFGANAEFVKGMTIAAAIADTYAGANKAFAQGGVLGTVTAAGIIAQGLMNVKQIEQAYSKAQEKSQYGFEGVVSEPTQFTVGEGGASEFVSVTPMEGVDNSGGGSGMNIQISGNVMTEDFVENELAEKIADAVRRGTDFGLS